MPKSIFEVVKPNFVSLFLDDLLKRRLHGQTQNLNESFNIIIWTKCPKAIYLTRSVLEMGVNYAVLEFNEGSHGINGVYSHFGFPSGVCTRTVSIKRGTSRVTKSHRKSSVTGKRRRKALGARETGLVDRKK